jgi:hypothetical protein
LAESDGKQNFWTTMPGILTGIAALLTAATGLFVAVYHSAGSSPSNEHPAPAAVSAPEPKPALPAANSTAAQTVKGAVTVTSRDGEITKLFLKSFQHNYTEKTIELTSGQTISFDRIKSIDFFSVDTDHLVAVKVTLTDGRAVEGVLRGGYAFVGESDIGPFRIQVENLKQILFP